MQPPSSETAAADDRYPFLKALVDLGDISTPSLYALDKAKLNSPAYLAELEEIVTALGGPSMASSDLVQQLQTVRISCPSYLEGLREEAKDAGAAVSSPLLEEIAAIERARERLSCEDEPSHFSLESSGSDANQCWSPPHSPGRGYTDFSAQSGLFDRDAGFQTLSGSNGATGVATPETSSRFSVTDAWSGETREEVGSEDEGYVGGEGHRGLMK